jgi:lysozyme
MEDALRQIIVPHLKKEEGFRPYCYSDSLGYSTIGYGRLVDRRKGGGISEKEAEMLLFNDLERFSADLDEKLPWWRSLDAVRRAVLLGMTFQMGISGLLGFKNTLKCVQEGDFGGAAGRMVVSRWAAQTPTRALRLANAMRTGDPRYLLP